MDYKAIEIHLKDNPPALDYLLEQYKPNFDRVDYYAKALQSGILNNGQDCVIAINELTGIYMSLKVVAYILVAEKENIELRYYVSEKERIAKEKGEAEVKDSVLKKSAALHVSTYRRIANIFEGYLDASEQAIQTIQSILKFLTGEILLHKGM